MKVLIAGDFVISQNYPTNNVSKDVIDLFKSSDYNIVNLEAPVTNCNKKKLKTGPHLKAHKESTLSVIKQLDVDLVTLANNHVFDYGEIGIFETLEFCKENAIATVGAGANKCAAAKVFYYESAEGKIAIINVAENEWASATDHHAGANGMDLIDDVKQIQEARAQSDLVFVIVHGGHEYYNLPSPRMQKQYRFYVDNGADIVIGHHTHCISGSEVYNGKYIYYSLGNFLFTKSSKFNDWYKGLVLEVEIFNGKIIDTKQVFIQQSKKDFSLSLAKDTELHDIKKRFVEYSKIIVDPAILISNWEIYIMQKSKVYDLYWSPLSFIQNKWVKKIVTKLRLMADNKEGKALLLNLMRCEAHRDMSKEILTRKLREN